MQVCKMRNGRISRRILNRFLVIFTLFIFLQNTVFSQKKDNPPKGQPQLDKPRLPDMPDVPQMPEITFPELGDSFYHPSVPVRISGKDGDKTSDTAEEKDNVPSPKEKASAENVIKSLLANEDLLSASDISSLYDYGMFSNLSSIPALSSNLYSAASQTTSSTVSASSTNILLQQILKELEELKNEQKKASSSEKQKQQNRQQDNQTFRQREPSILRFKINGQNIADSLTTVFFSEPDPDGSFLLTADRKYFVNQKALHETFYLLFRTKKSNGAVTTFEVIPSLVQDTRNSNSFIYKFCQQKDITAQKTGNLIVLNFSSDGLQTDMLLDIDKTDN